jgi:hypothetical protein
MAEIEYKEFTDLDFDQYLMEEVETIIRITNEAQAAVFPITLYWVPVSTETQAYRMLLPPFMDGEARDKDDIMFAIGFTLAMKTKQRFVACIVAYEAWFEEVSLDDPKANGKELLSHEVEVLMIAGAAIDKRQAMVILPIKRASEDDPLVFGEPDETGLRSNQDLNNSQVHCRMPVAAMSGYTHGMLHVANACNCELGNMTFAEFNP